MRPVTAIALLIVFSAPLSASTLCIEETSGLECRSLADSAAIRAASTERKYWAVDKRRLTIGVIAPEATALPDAVATIKTRFSMSPAAPETSAMVRITRDVDQKLWDIPFTAQDLRSVAELALPAGRYKIELTAEHYYGGAVAVSTDELPALPTIMHLQREPLIEATVVAGGVPVPGALVRRPDSGAVLATTASDGSFALFIPHDEWPEQLMVEHAALGVASIDMPPRSADVPLGTIVLRPRGTLALRLAHVQPATIEILARILTADDRRYRVVTTTKVVEGAAEDVSLAPGNYVLRAKGDGPLQRLTMPVDVVSGETREVLIPNNDRSLTIRVLDQQGSAPAATLELRGPEDSWAETVEMDATGEYVTTVWQSDELHALVKTPAMILPRAFHKTLGEEKNAEWNITLYALTIEGTVVDDKDGAGIPGASIRLVATKPTGQSTSITRTDATGRFSINNLEPANHQITASADGFLPEEEQFTLTNAETSRTVELRLRRGNAHQLQVISADGAPIADAIILLDPPVVAPVLTGGDGKATITLPIDAPTATAFVVPTRGSFCIAELTRSTSQTLIVPPGTVNIKILTQTREGDPVGGIGVLVRYGGRLLPVDVLRMMVTEQGQRFRSDASGVITLTGLPEGRYELWPLRDYSRANEAVGMPPVVVPARAGQNFVTITVTKE